MPWTKRNYPVSMKNLSAKVRNKAIEIANALLEDGRDEGSAIAIATAQAQRWAGEGEEPERHYHVQPHERGWMVKRTRAGRASAIFADKAEAKKRALELAKREGVYTVIHDQRGRETESIAPDAK